MSTALTTLDAKFKDVSGMLEKLKPAMGAALPKHLNPDRMARLALTAIRKTPDLLDCDQRSLAGAIMQAAQMGLEIDGYEAHLLPFNNSRTGRKEAQLIPDYKGLVKLMWQSGMVESLQADVVYEGDHFAYTKGDDEKITHVPIEQGDKRWPVVDGRPVAYDAREITHAYAIVTIKGGGKQRMVVPRVELENLRKKMTGRMRNPQSTPWYTDFAAMCKKTALRRIAKFVPRATDRAALLHYASQLDEYAEAGLSQELLAPELPQEVEGEKPKTGLAAVKEELKGKAIPALCAHASAIGKIASLKPGHALVCPDCGEELKAGTVIDTDIPIPASAPECAGCGLSKPTCDATDSEGRAWHEPCKKKAGVK